MAYRRMFHELGKIPILSRGFEHLWMWRIENRQMRAKDKKKHKAIAPKVMLDLNQ